MRTERERERERERELNFTFLCTLNVSVATLSQRHRRVQWQRTIIVQWREHRLLFEYVNILDGRLYVVGKAEHTMVEGVGGTSRRYTAIIVERASLT